MVVVHADSLKDFEGYEAALEFFHHGLAVGMSAEPFVVVKNVLVHSF